MLVGDVGVLDWGASLGSICSVQFGMNDFNHLISESGNGNSVHEEIIRQTVDSIDCNGRQCTGIATLSYY